VIQDRNGPAWRAAILAGLLASLLAACGQTPSNSRAFGSVPPASPIDGVVLSIDSGGLTDVHGFTLRTAAGQVLTFKLGTLENPTQFPPGHLAEHQANALPVRVYFIAGDGTLVVYRLEDAPARPT
jgi:hypothetical protein